jgi:hypothetical protein
MAGTYAFYEKRTGTLMSFAVHSPHDCMTQLGISHCPACREEHEILRKHNEEMKDKDREKRRKK